MITMSEIYYHYQNGLIKLFYMFHYLPSDTFSEFERQNASHVLMELKKAVKEIYLNNKKTT